jgi:hypothetical protein
MWCHRACTMDHGQWRLHDAYHLSHCFCSARPIRASALVGRSGSPVRGLNPEAAVTLSITGY